MRCDVIIHTAALPHLEVGEKRIHTTSVARRCAEGRLCCPREADGGASCSSRRIVCCLNIVFS